MSASAEPGPVRTATTRRAVPPGVTAVVAISLSAAALAKFDLSGRGFVAAIFCAALVVLSAIDIETRLIPNRIVLPAAAVVLVGDIVVEPDQASEWLISAAAAGIIATVIVVVTRGGLGAGDAKLCVLLGAGLGYAVLGGLVVGTLAGGMAAIVLLARNGADARRTMLPYGPFLALGGVIALFLT